MQNYVLDSSNNPVGVTFAGSTLAVGQATFDGLPLGLVNGELMLKVTSGGTGTNAGQVQGVAASGASAVGNPVRIGSVTVDPAALPTYIAGKLVSPGLDLAGNMFADTRLLTTADAITSTPVASSTASTTAYATSKIIKASAGRLFSVNGYNSKASAQFIQLHDSATLPADAAVPIAILSVPAASNFSIDFGALGIPCANGIVICNSSTGPAKTIGSADIWVQGAYV